MPLYKRSEFVPKKPPPDLRPDEDVFFLKLTNEIFRDYDEYFDRMILCNSLVWSCSLTGKANLTFQEAVDSEKSAKKLLKGFPRDLKKALFYLVSQTCRSKVLDVCEDVFAYARERYFKNEPVLGVIGNMWCPSKVLRVIYPTKDEIEAYRKDQIEKGMYEQNDYLKDDSWGPPPDLFRYEVEEIEPDNPVYKVHILEAIDVKREKTFLTRDKSRYLMKLSTYYSEKDRKWRLKEEVIKAFGLNQIRFEDIFTGPQPKFEDTPGPPIREVEKKLAAKTKTPNNNEPNKKKSLSTDSKPKKEGKTPVKKETNGETKKKRSKSEEPQKKTKSSNSTKIGDQERKSVPNPSNSPSTPGGKKRGPKPKEKKPKEPEKEVEKKLTVQELKQIETERKAKEREDLKQQKKLIADFKKLWFKPKEDLEVEDLKDLPAPDPVSCSIPNNLFGDFVTVLEYFNCYANVLKVRDCFSSGLSFDQLERALVKNEIAGPFSDIVQLLLRAIFRLQESEHSEINQENTAGAELDVDEIAADVSTQEAITQATTAATWSQMYQNTPLHKLTLDHLSLTEVLRLHLLSSGAKPSEKDVKWRWQSRGCFDCEDDPGLILRLEEPQIIKTLTQGSVMDLTIAEKLKVLLCLINQVLTFYDVREMMEDAMEQLKQTKMALRSLQAAEKRKETEENLWKTRLRQDKLIPDMNALKELKELKAATEKDKVGEKTNSEEKPQAQPPPQPDKPLLTDQEIEALIEKKDKEITKRKEEVDWREAELMDAMLKHERKLGIHPVGRDRAYRRYWIFNTIPGIFVEQDDEFVGSCLSNPTPYLSDVNLNDVNFVKENFEKLMQVDREGSDKENSTLASPKKAPKKKQPSSKSKDAPPRPEVFGICTGDAKLCPVHSKYSPHHKWSFYWSVEQLDQLIEGLTPRGIREKDLKQTLVDEKEGLVNLLKRCPVSKLNIDNPYPEHMLSIAERKQQRGGQSSKHLDPNLNYPEGTTLEEIQELQLRDLILEMEEKVFLGTLGSLKITDRQAWRTAIEGRTYDMQADAVSWGKDKSITKEELEKLAKGSIKKLNSMKSNDDASSSSASSNTENRPNNESVPINPVIRDLACAILQFRQSLEAKFFKKPLGFGKDDGKNKGKAAIAENKTTDHINKGTSLSPIERWELSLMASTSFSQLFLHLFTLDNSIEWSRSVLNARCRVCRRKGDPDNMLLCDECNKGHHAYCLKPRLDVIPKGDWYCSDCRPPEPEPRQNRRARNKPLSREEILDELERDSDEDEDEEEEEEERGSPRRRKGRNTRASVDEDDDEDDEDVETCEMCGFGGKVICCDKCPKVYHLECLNPPMSRVPRGQWFCPKCSSSNNKTSKKKKSNSSKSKGKKKKVSRKNSSSEEEESDIDDSQDSDNDAVDDTNAEDDGVNQDSNGSDNEGDEDGKAMSGNESDAESDSGIPKVKVKIGNHSSKNQRSTRSSRNRKYVSDSEEEEESDGGQTGRGRKRKSASQANLRIRQVTKRLRSDSKENSESSNDSNSLSRKRNYESDSNGVGHDAPKRTRLQRMNTNQCNENGELDNVLLDRLLHDVMKHSEAWPFLKPVTKTEAPDYHEIVRYPMDLGTIKYKLNSMVYTCNEELISDLNLVFANCLQYNDPTHPVYKAGKNLRAFCERRLSKLSINFQDPSTTSTSVNNTN